MAFQVMVSLVGNRLKECTADDECEYEIKVYKSTLPLYFSFLSLRP